MKRHILIVFICLLTGYIHSQNDHLYGVEEFSSEALTSSLINKIVQDNYGFIWIATDYGLNKFDGVRFIQYLHNENDSKSLISNNIRTLMVDKENTLWVGSDKGIQYYQPNENSFKTIKFPKEITPHIATIYQLKNGNIWALSSELGFFSIDKENSSANYLKDITLLTGISPTHIYEDNHSNIWISIYEKGLIRINPIDQKHSYYSIPNLPHNNITGIIEGPDNLLYISMTTSICYYDKFKDRFIEIDVDDSTISITDMFVTKKGIIYVSTDGQGLKYIDKEKKKLYSVDNIKTSYNYKSAKIHTLIEDRDQNLWLGCFLKGILMIPNEQTQFNYQRILNKEQQLGSTLTSIFQDNNDIVWCGTNQDGIILLDTKGNIIKHILDVKDIMKIYQGRDKTLWVISYNNGLGTINRETGKYSFKNIPFDGYYMKTMVEGFNNNLFISNFGHGFISYNIQTEKWEEFNSSSNDIDIEKGKLDNDWINSIICDTEGLIWLGHYKGVSCYDPEQRKFIKGKYNDLLASQICLSLMEGKNKKIWVGTYNGIFCIDKKTKNINRYTINEGLSSNVICGLAQDEEGNVWCSTFNGINKIKIKENKIINYYLGNGLVEKIYNRGVYYQGTNGIVFFGGNNGITSFNPSEINIPEYDYDVIITNVYINNQPINNRASTNASIINTNLYDARDFRFSYENNSFTFEFSTMDFQSPENIYYEYRIKEFNGEWISTLPGVNQITYNHLKPGIYTLLIRACKYGFYSSEKELILTINPPWYRTTLAYLIYLGIIFTIGILITSLILRKRKEKINESKLQFFINISHEIRSPLTLILSPMEKLLKENFDTETLKTLNVIHRNSIRILGLVNQLLDVRKIDKGQMKMNYSEIYIDNFIYEIIKVFEEQATKRSINLQFDNQAKNLQVWIDENNFDKILMNLLSNAFKYTPDGGEVKIKLQIGADNKNKGPLHSYFEINIIDSGVGLIDSEKDKIFKRFYQGNNQETFTTIGSGIGLNLTKKLVQLHHGIITADNRTDIKGSCFTIRIPLGKKHLKKEELLDKRIKRAEKQKLFIAENINKEKSIKRNKNHTILIIDDEKEIREYLKDELENRYQVITAKNGVEGFKSAVANLPSLIISDVMMPEMDGFKLVNMIKKNIVVRHIPIILLTSKTEYEDRINALEKGADSYLTKPFNIDELLITINNLISSRSILRNKFSGAQDQAGKIKLVKFKSSDEKLIERIMEQINDNIGNPKFNVEMLASNIGLSRVQLHRKLKELTGLSTGDFIRNIRIKQACVLLKQKKMNISQIAYAVGFLNQTHFSTLFKKTYGVSPKEFISQIEENEELNDET